MIEDNNNVEQTIENRNKMEELKNNISKLSKEKKNTDIIQTMGFKTRTG